MSRFHSIACVLAALALTGCQPKNPLDWRIDASSPDAYNLWVERHHHLLPPELQQDFDRAFANLRFDAATKLGSTQLKAVYNVLCPRLNGKTIREAILAADEVEANALRLRISTLVDQITRNVKVRESLPDAAAEKRFDEARIAEETAIQSLRVRIAEIDAQVRQLTAGVR